MSRAVSGFAEAESTLLLALSVLKKTQTKQKPRCTELDKADAMDMCWATAMYNLGKVYR